MAPSDPNDGERAEPAAQRTRAAFAGLLLVLAALLTPLSVVAVWASSLVENTDRYVATVAPLAGNPAVQNAVADRLAGAVTQNLSAGSLLQQIAPSEQSALGGLLGQLSGPIDSALQGLVRNQAQNVVSSPAFATFWVQANRTVHDQFSKALTGKGGGAVQLTNNAVTIDLAPLIDQLKQQLVNSGVGVASLIPTIHVQYTVVDSSEVGTVRTGIRLLELAGAWLPVVTVLFAALGLLLARHRRHALIALALGVTVATIALGIGLSVFRVLYLDALPASVSQPAAGAVYDALIRLLRVSVRTYAVLGLAVALGAWLSGPTRPARQLRDIWQAGPHAARAAAGRAGLHTGPVGPWVHRFKPVLTWTVVGAAGLTLVLWSYPTGWVVVVLGLAVVFALTLIELLDVVKEEQTAEPGAR
ncbi:hypothetical protein [Kitasatospora kifunensis]|uniref:Integral membrane protein n=1 Tax=Kitasatospora kifunensis TaxID=58351 RepID=A0A7W7QXB4_KITKI|nr:hypothetical protein [Kitasatospora kifunensis]MBB4921531.1 hypothetical protein [Kitasatospora kifunensis]